MPNTVYTLLFALLGLIFLSAFFSGSETGIMSLNRYRLRHLAQQSHNYAARRVQNLLERPDRLLALILIGNTFANILASAIATVIATQIWGGIGVLISTLGLTLILLIFAEITPKTLAALYPQRIAFLAVLPLQTLLIVFYPFVWFANAISNGLLRLCRIDTKQRRLEHLSADELRTVIHEAGALISDNHQAMLLQILDLGKITVEDIMVPKNEIIGIDLEVDWEQIKQQLLHSQHNHLPVYTNSIDQVQGILHIRKILDVLAQGKLFKENLLEVLLPVYFIPKGTPLNTQLLNFRMEKRRNGLVVDEYGDLQGLVTLEDILEEIVGEFTSNIETTEQLARVQLDGSYLVDGSITLRELNRLLGWNFPSRQPKTLSGLIIEYLQTIPHAGTCLRLFSYPMEIIQIKDNMVKTIHVLANLKK